MNKMEYGHTAHNRSVYVSPPVGGSAFRVRVALTGHSGNVADLTVDTCRRGYVKTILRKAVFLGLFLVVGVGTSFARTLTIRIENIEPGKGYLMVGVFNSNDDFPNTYFQGQRIRATNRTLIVAFNSLPAGTYAVSVYQDVNENEQLDKNIFGIPKERYGFSNKSDRPVYERCLFDFNSDRTITIKLNK